MKFFGAVFFFTLTAAADKPGLPDGPGKQTTEKLCSACHGVNIFVNRRESRDGWNSLVEEMIRHGMQGEDEEVGEVSTYLAKHLSRSTPAPRVNVNQSTARELAVGLGIAESKTRVIVKYREANGNFKKIEDLLKVPGIEAQPIEAKRNEIDY